MKKIWLLLCMICLLMVGGTASAGANYPDHLGGDSNFICVDGHMGYGFYLDRSSLVVEEYNPPEYRIAVNVCEVENPAYNTAIGRVFTNEFAYNWTSRRMYVNSNGRWRYLDPNGS
ncbi:MAG: hypothetical protein LKE33_12925 [Acidaminococcus sp.]|jgi:hypothetical protein|nr:hypothetical protein [Acidaminococcus sp.]MCI2100706.1 hypothetical protein [Acidaminococcus sp.]MCI2115027.1 hypothetical protein [Acidaminococcus sp.]MCI2117102.1 hypothetical protein [Acidaminococcus sp.]